jgi:DNA-binding winged helix-turn-helix (wHTH) protein/tetratricopeptide (TPR) repeat protein
MSASASHPDTELYEFGPFRVDAQREILLRAGEPVPLTPKTFQILLVLVRHSQEVVTKDDLMKAVWPDTFVEEANLSRNIFMLRKALGESPQDHRYIVTVPGRGYRLAESVHLVPEHEVNIVAATRSRVEVEVKETRTWGWIAVIVALLLIAGAAVLSLSLHRAAILSEKDTLVLADFANSTRDPVFEETLRQGLAVQLEQSPFLSVISEERIQKTLRLMGRPVDARLTPEVAREVCERTGSAAVLNGSIARLGSQYVLGLRARKCGTGEILADEQVQAGRKEDVLNALSQMAKSFRTRVGESLATVQKHGMPLAEATTQSLEALRAYSLGYKVTFSSSGRAALPFFQRAVEIDPKFAMPYLWMGLVYTDMGESVRATQSTSRAYELRDRTSDREKLFIAAVYDTQVTGNLEKAQQTYELLEQFYPRVIDAPGPLSGFIYPVFGKYEEAIEQAKKAIALDPDFPFAYVNLIDNNLYLGRLAEAENALARASERKFAVDELLIAQYATAFLKGDTGVMEQALASAQNRPSAEDWLTDNAASALAYCGRLREAKLMVRRAVDLAQQAEKPESAALYATAAAIWDALFGNPSDARRSAIAVVQLSKARDVEYGAALALALSGDLSRSQSLADELEQRFPEDTSVRYSYLPVLRALAVLKRKPSKAIELLQVAGRYELGTPGSSANGSFGSLYPIYVRGEAYMAAHQGAVATAEFQKILDHRWVLVTDSMGPLAHLQLARALILSGDREKAKAAYEDFFAIWKRADPDIPVLKQAKAEYAKLQ